MPIGDEPPSLCSLRGGLRLFGVRLPRGQAQGEEGTVHLGRPSARAARALRVPVNGVCCPLVRSRMMTDAPKPVTLTDLDRDGKLAWVYCNA
jgi:hypothetical protein